MTREEAIQILSTRDAHGVLCGYTSGVTEALDMAITALQGGDAKMNEIKNPYYMQQTPSEDGNDLIIKGAKGIKDGLYNIKDGKLFKYKANGGTVRTYPIVPSADIPTEDYSDLPDIPRAYYEKIVGNMAHEINMLKEQLESADAVQGCDGCRYNTRTPQEQCLRCKRYWRDSYERKGGEDE